jgi:hypothetical protein
MVEMVNLTPSMVKPPVKPTTAPVVKPPPTPVGTIKPTIVAPSIKPTTPAVKPPAPTVKPPTPAAKPPTPAAKPPTPVYPKGLVRALYIGLNYTTIPQYQLQGCMNDIMRSQILIKQLYPACNDVRTITDLTETKPTKENILSAIEWLVSGLQPGQNVFFHFSGHGGLMKDENGDEKSGVDSCIYGYNQTELETILDDELRAALAVKIPSGSKCFAVFDCCNSGTALDLQYSWQAPSNGKLTFSQDWKYSRTRGQVIFLSASKDDQYAMDTVNALGSAGGALTFALMTTWQTYRTTMKVKHLLWDVRTILKNNGYSQIPQISSGMPMSSEEVLDLSK